jgi:hypothetical protein
VVPAGLVEAIHSRLGPGSIGLGTVPSGGPTPSAPAIVPVTTGWILQGSGGPVRAFLTRSGTTQVEGPGRARASLTPTALVSGQVRRLLAPPASRLGAGGLTQQFGLLRTVYTATGSGLEQRFVIPRALDPRASSLTVAFASSTRWRIEDGGEAVSTVGAGGRLLYAGLRTTDRTGRTLPSRFVVRRSGPTIAVSTHGARFPLTVDPTWLSSSNPQATLASSTGRPADYLGYAVSLSADGTTALVGAYGVNSASGMAYLFQIGAGGSWSNTATPTAVLTNATGAAGDRFGVSVALSADGTTAVVGADGAGTGTGAAYVYTAAAENAWSTTSTPSAVLSNAADAVNSYFGSSVAVSGDDTTALVGAYGVGSGRGAANVFSASAKTAWATTSTPAAVLSDTSSPVNGFLGYSVSLSADGRAALVGSFGTAGGRGSADVFRASAETAWATTSTPAAVLSDSQAASGAFLGESVALSADGTTALVGMWGGAGDTGQGDVFTIAAETSWATTSTPTAVLTNGAGAVGDRFGLAVALSGDGTTALLGAAQAGGAAGAADIFVVPSETAWATTSAPTSVLTDPAGRAFDLLGGAVALSYDGLTALADPYGARSDTGAVEVFEAATLPGAPTITFGLPGNDQVTVAFTKPLVDGHSPVTAYTVTASDVTNPANGGQSASGPQSPIVVGGLTNGDTYTFTVTATNGLGTGPPSASSKPVVPLVLAPRVASVNPSVLPQGSSRVPLVLTGTNFLSGMKVFASSGVQLSSVTVVDATTADVMATVTATAAVGPRNLTSQDVGGLRHCTACLTVAPAPTLTRVSPSTVAAGATTALVLTGSGIEDGATVHAQGAAGGLRFTAVIGTGTSATTKAVATATAVPGTYTLVLTNPDHSSARCSGCLMVS